jgi:hypothetical protein
LKEAAKEYNLPGMNFIKLMTAFDVNGNSIVELIEFVELIENAMGGAEAKELYNPSPPKRQRWSGGL